MNRISIFIILVLTLVSCDSKSGLDIATFQGEALGTTYSVQYFSEGELDFTRSMDSPLLESHDTRVKTEMINIEIRSI